MWICNHKVRLSTKSGLSQASGSLGLLLNIQLIASSLSARFIDGSEGIFVSNAVAVAEPSSLLFASMTLVLTASRRPHLSGDLLCHFP
jgi:hypothetical protein